MKISITLRINGTEGNVLIDYKARPIDYVFDDAIKFIKTYNSKYCSSKDEGPIKIAKIFEDNEFYMMDNSNKTMIDRYGKIFAKKRVLSKALAGFAMKDLLKNNDNADGLLLIDFDKRVITPNFFMVVTTTDYLNSYFLGNNDEKEDWDYYSLEEVPFEDLDNINFIDIEDFKDFMSRTEMDGFRKESYPNSVIMTKF